MAGQDARVRIENTCDDELFAAPDRFSLGSEGLLTLDEAARYLGLHKDHGAPVHAVRYLCRTRKLRFVKIGKTLRFRREWLDEYVDSQSIAPIARRMT